MSRPARGSAVILVTALAAISAIGCSDALPTETSASTQSARFALSEAAATEFSGALEDVRNRILPGLDTVDAADSIAPLLDQLARAIATRDQRMLRLALARTDAALVELGRDPDAAAIGSELDAMRLILEHARPLAAGESGTITR